MSIEWKAYESPYKDTILEIPKQLEYVFNSNDTQEEIEIYLYSELGPNIKHQGKIYNVIFPVIEYIESHFSSGNTKNKIPLLYFLEYIFHEFIRDAANFLYTPIRYKYKSKKIRNLNIEETKAFDKFKQLYHKYFYETYDYKNFSHKIFYDCIFLNSNLAYNNIICNLNNGDVSLDMGIALGYLSFKNNYFSNNIRPEIFESLNDNIDIILSINQLPFNESNLVSQISDYEEISNCWGSRFISIIAGCSYVISIRNKEYEIQRRSIDKLLKAYEKLKENYNKEYELDFPIYKYLLEDTSSILFYQFLGQEKGLTVEHLNPIQTYFLNQLNDKYRTHTYSLLYAGVLPKGIDHNNIDGIYDIHECY